MILSLRQLCAHLENEKFVGVLITVHPLPAPGPRECVEGNCKKG